jgi:D-3-phosphoglycerate dehydrogenase
MKVVYYDIEEKLALGNAERARSLKDLLSKAEVISMHVDGRPENENIIGTKQFELMRDGVIFINLSRGHVVDISALKSAILSGKVAGASVDVFPEEPKNNNDPFDSELKGLPNLILTPHIGGSTEEAQINIAEFVPNKIMDYVNTGNTGNSVNFPNLSLPELKDAHRFIHVHSNEPGVLAEINKILAEHKINIVGQYLKTNEKIGYVITDIDKDYEPQVKKDLKKIKGTLRFRVLY